jgi:hypothetical protein
LRNSFLELAFQTKEVELNKSLSFENQAKVNNTDAYKIKKNNNSLGAHPHVQTNSEIQKSKQNEAPKQVIL